MLLDFFFVFFCNMYRIQAVPMLFAYNQLGSAGCGYG